ncbi:MAG: TRAP transporter TatT component family protein [Candidatus Coatesbacteria bacterium]
MHLKRSGVTVALAAALTLGGGFLAGCSIRRVAVDGIGNSLTSGPSVFETDDDIELVGDALPFSLKLLEMLLNESPNHPGLLLSACKGYTLYAYAYVQRAAEAGAETDIEKSRETVARAKKLYLRAVGYGLRGLDQGAPGLSGALEKDPKAAAAKAHKEDVPLLYWTAAALGLAISANKGNAEMIARLPEVDALLARGLALDEAWDGGQLHEFAITFAAANPAATPDPKVLQAHYDRALALSEGKRASLFVTWAESVSIPRQRHAEFTAMLEKALAVDVEASPNLRLSNQIALRRARWLQGRADTYFLDDSTPATEGSTP